MCMVSAMTTPWEQPNTAPLYPIYIPVVTPAGQEDYPWTRPTWAQFKEILDKLKDLDTKLGLKDCEDPAKGEWMSRVEARLEQLEADRA